MTKKVFQLVTDAVRRNACQAVNTAPDGYWCEIKPRTRSLDQSAKLHSIFAEVARQKEWQGRKLAPEQWKVLFISGHAIATKQGADMVPGLESEFVNLRESSAAMSIARMNSLLEYVLAWCAENGIEVHG